MEQVKHCNLGAHMNKARKKKLVAVNHAGRRIGDTHQRAKHPEEVLVRIRNLRTQGMSYLRISQAVAVPKTTVRDILKGLIRAQPVAKWRPPGRHLRQPGEAPAFLWPTIVWPPRSDDDE